LVSNLVGMSWSNRFRSEEMAHVVLAGLGVVEEGLSATDGCGVIPSKFGAGTVSLPILAPL
jgi:hypothetical protein